MNERIAYAVAIYARSPSRDRVLLINHLRLSTKLPPGGEVEAEERPVDAAVREAREELGWEEGRDYTFLEARSAYSPRGYAGYGEHAVGAKGTHLIFSFFAQAHTFDVRPNEEFVAWRWVLRDDVLDDRQILPHVREYSTVLLLRGGCPRCGRNCACEEDMYCSEQCRHLDRVMDVQAPARWRS